MLVASGSYTGNATDDRSITGIGFEPGLVIIHGSGSGNGAWRSSAHTGDDSNGLAGALANFANGIQAFESDGFQIGTHTSVNTASTEYHWMAFKDNGDSDFVVGTYTGDGVDDRDIAGLGFDPDLVVVGGAADSRLTIYRTADFSGDLAGVILFGGTAVANRIQGFGTGSFQVGTSGYANASGETYYYFAFKNVSGEFQVLTYTGNAADNRSITGAGFEPDIAFSIEDGASKGIFRNSAHVGDSSLIGQGSNAANRIQAFEADGFQIGTSGAINENGATYYAFAWKHVTGAAPEGWDLKGGLSLMGVGL